MSYENIRFENKNFAQKPPSGKINRRQFVKGVFATAAIAAVENLPLDALNDIKNKEHSLENYDVFDKSIQREILCKVSEYMYVPKEVELSLPKVIIAESVHDEEFHIIAGYDTGKERINKFVPPDKIYLMKKSRVGNLAHEFAHYVQYQYRGIKEGNDDFLELEAVKIQNMFE